MPNDINEKGGGTESWESETTNSEGLLTPAEIQSNADQIKLFLKVEGEMTRFISFSVVVV